MYIPIKVHTPTLILLWHMQTRFIAVKLYYWTSNNEVMNNIYPAQNRNYITFNAFSGTISINRCHRKGKEGGNSKGISLFYNKTREYYTPIKT